MLDRFLGSGGRAHITLGTLIGSGTTVLAAPVLTRLYDPGAVGAFAIAVLVATTASVVASHGQDLDLYTCGQVEFPGTLTSALLRAMATTVAGGLLALAGWRLHLIDSGLATAAVGVLGSAAVLRVFTASSLRHQQFTAAGLSRALYGTVSTISQIGLGLVMNGHGTQLVAGVLIGNVAAILPLVPLRPLLDRWRFLPSRSGRASLSLGLATINASSPTLLLGLLGTPASVGAYSMANRVPGTVLGVLVQPLGQVMTADVARIIRDGGASRVRSLQETTKKCVGLATVCVIAMLLLAAFVEEIFGPEWTSLTGYLVVLAPLAFFQLSFSNSNLLLSVTGHGSTSFRWEVRRTVLGTATLAALLVFIEPLPALAAFSGLQSALYFAVYLVTLRHMRNDDGRGTP